MATKDWKKVKGSTDTYEKKGIYLFPTMGKISGAKPFGKWSLVTNNKGYIHLQAFADRKNQILRKLKIYMEKH